MFQLNNDFELAEAQLKSSESFLIFNFTNVNCNVFGSFKKLLKSYNVYVRHYKTKYIKHALFKTYPSAVSAVKGQCFVADIMNSPFEAYRTINVFLKTHSLKELVFVLNHRLMDSVCSKIFARFKSKTELKSQFLSLIETPIARLLFELECPLLGLEILTRRRMLWTK
ncbi:MAG: 50S ribosomal protein L10 [Candidatus Hodgkinia cicadicola]